MIRDRLLARLAEMGDEPDHQRLAADVLGIRGAPPDLARKLVAQALVLEDRREEWRQIGERICRAAPTGPGVYVLKDALGRPLYVGKAVNLRRRLRAHFAERRWRAVKAGMSRATQAEWTEVGSELEALVREAASIVELQPVVNVQRRAVSRPLERDVVVIVPSVEADSAELVCASVKGGCMILRTRRTGVDLGVHSRRLRRFFQREGASHMPGLAPIVFTWLARRGAAASRLDPHDASSAKVLALRLGALLRDERLFHERLEHS